MARYAGTLRRFGGRSLLFLGAIACTPSTSDPSGPKPSASVAQAAAAPKLPPTGDCDPGCHTIERCEKGRCVPDCPEGEVYIPPTPKEGYVQGNGEPGDYNQKHLVVLTRPFCMDETEVTVSAYRACVEAKQCTLPELNDVNCNYNLPNREDHPLNMVTWDQAIHYCQLRDKDLPTEAQFEWAAGQGKHRYPWGDEDPTCENGLADFTPGGAPKWDPAGDVGCHGGNTSPVKAHPKGKTIWPDGDIYDLGGNVWEWTKDCAWSFPAEKQVDPYREFHPRLHDTCFVYSLRGGGWNRSKYALRVYYRGAARRNYHVPGLGFRCVRNPVNDLAPPTPAPSASTTAE